MRELLMASQEKVFRESLAEHRCFRCTRLDVSSGEIMDSTKRNKCTFGHRELSVVKKQMGPSPYSLPRWPEKDDAYGGSFTGGPMLEPGSKHPRWYGI